MTSCVSWISFLIIKTIAPQFAFIEVAAGRFALGRGGFCDFLCVLDLFSLKYILSPRSHPHMRWLRGVLR